MADKTERLAIIVSAQNLASRSLKSVAKDLGSLDRAAVKSAGIAAHGSRTAIGNISKLAMAGAALAIGGGAAAVKWAGDFQAQLNTINTIAMTTPAGLKAIGDEILVMSRKTGIGLDDLTSSYYDLLSAGVKAKDAQAILNDAVTLGVGGLATTGEAVDLLTTAYNAYGLTAGQAAKATDMFAQAVADGKVKASEIAASFADVASLAKSYNIGINQIAASYAFLTAQGVPAAEVTTEMNRAIISLIKPSKDLKVAQKKLGVDFTAEIKKKGLVGALEELRKYSDETGVPMIKLLGRVEAVKYALQTTGPNAKGYADELVRINGSAGEAAKQAAERQQGLNFQLARLKQEAISAGITIGNELVPTLTDLADQANAFLEGHQGDIQQFGRDLGKAFREGVIWAKKLDWAGIGHALQDAAGFGKMLIQAFADAPQWLQTAVVTGWGLNKLSGGAVVDIGATLGKGALGSALGSLGGLFSRGASPAAPLFVKDVGGGLPGGLPAAAGASGAAAVAVGAAALVGTDIALQSIAHNPNFGQVAANAFGVKTPGQTSFGSGVGGSALQNAIDAQRRSNGTDGGSGGLSPDDRQAARDAAQSLRDVKDASQGTAAEILKMGNASKEAAKKFDPAKAARDLVKGIRERSAAKYGGAGLGKAAVMATTNRDLEGQARSIAKSGKDSAWKLERLKEVAATAKAAGATQASSIVAHLIAVETAVNGLDFNIVFNAAGEVVGGSGSTKHKKKHPGHSHGGVTGPDSAGGGIGQAGHTYRINEDGTEYFTPGVTGRISPTGSINAAAARQLVLHATILIPPLSIDPKGATHGLQRFQSTVLGKTG